MHCISRTAACSQPTHGEEHRKLNVGTVEGNIHTQVTVQLRERSAKPVESKTTTPKSAATVRTPTHQNQEKDTTHYRKKSTRKVNQGMACSEKTCRDSSCSEDAYVYLVNSNACVKRPQTHVKLNGVGVLIDSGAAVNIMSEEGFNTLKPMQRLSTAKIKIFSCNVQATQEHRACSTFSKVMDFPCLAMQQPMSLD